MTGRASASRDCSEQERTDWLCLKTEASKRWKEPQLQKAEPNGSECSGGINSTKRRGSKHGLRHFQGSQREWPWDWKSIIRN